jgi:hypothetical protein
MNESHWEGERNHGKVTLSSRALIVLPIKWEGADQSASLQEQSLEQSSIPSLPHASAVQINNFSKHHRTFCALQLPIRWWQVGTKPI